MEKKKKKKRSTRQQQQEQQQQQQQGRSLDDEIVQLWKEISPSSAYTVGFEEFAGRLFIPSDTNIQNALVRVRSLRRRAENDLQAKVLDSMEVALSFEEPQPVLDDIVGAIFNHLTKEGINEKHLGSLISASFKAIDATQKRFGKAPVPAAVKALTLYRLDGVIEVLDAIQGQLKGGGDLKQDCERLKERTRKFVSAFQLDGFGKGTFEEVEKVFKDSKFELGRERFYRAALENGFDYTETPDELESKGLAWLKDELPMYRAVVKRLAKLYGCPPTPEAVEKRLVERSKLKPRDLIRVTNAMRKLIQAFVDTDVVRINKKYKTKVVETPDFLSGMLPTGAASFFDTFTQRPFQLYFLTTDPKRDPPKSVSQLIDLLVHEEYGHCVNHSNSVLRFGGRASTLELLPTLLQGPVTEGLSFNREREFLEASLSLEGKAKSALTSAERQYVDLLERHGGLHLVNTELEFQTRKWRLIRFLRVIGDVRINTGKQSLFEFIDWANRTTGVPRSNVYYQLFPAHEGMFPGYATAYAVVGEEIHSIEENLSEAKDRVKFSTYLTGIGFPPRSVYRRMLEDYANSLKKKQREN